MPSKVRHSAAQRVNATELIPQPEVGGGGRYSRMASRMSLVGRAGRDGIARAKHHYLDCHDMPLRSASPQSSDTSLM